MSLPNFMSNSESATAFLCFYLSLVSAAADEKPSAYEALQQYGFPAGILPKGVIRYGLNKATGEFTAYLNDTWSFSIQNSYELNYKSTVKGVISKGRLRKLRGVCVKVLIVWLNIVEVRGKNDQLEFSVGIAFADFGIKNFEESPECGCGFDCGRLTIWFLLLS